MKRTDERLGSAPLGRLMLSMAVPAVAAQLINMLYNIVDRIYIGHIEGYGDLALTGVGVTFPIVMLITAFSAFAGMGGAPLASIQLGRKNYAEAEKILGNSTGLSSFWVVFAILVFGGLWGFVGMLLGVPFMALIYYLVHEIVAYFLEKRGISEDEIDYEKLKFVNKDTNKPEYFSEDEK